MASRWVTRCFLDLTLIHSVWNCCLSNIPWTNMADLRYIWPIQVNVTLDPQNTRNFHHALKQSRPEFLFPSICVTWEHPFTRWTDACKVHGCRRCLVQMCFAFRTARSRIAVPSKIPHSTIWRSKGLARDLSSGGNVMNFMDISTIRHSASLKRILEGVSFFLRLFVGPKDRQKMPRFVEASVWQWKKECTLRDE